MGVCVCVCVELKYIIELILSFICLYTKDNCCVRFSMLKDNLFNIFNI